MTYQELLEKDHSFKMAWLEDRIAYYELQAKIETEFSWDCERWGDGEGTHKNHTLFASDARRAASRAIGYYCDATRIAFLIKNFGVDHAINNVTLATYTK